MSYKSKSGILSVEIYKSLVILALSSTFQISEAQILIKGTVASEQERLPFATVLLLTKDSLLVKGTVTSQIGEFILEDITPGDYIVTASMLGYEKYTSDRIQLEKDDRAFIEIILSERSTQLGEIEVNAERPLYEASANGLIINTQQSITSSGNSVLEVLQKSPGISLNRQSNTVSMNGKSGIRVMVNGKMLQLSPDAVIQMLDGLSASNVDKIELITNPTTQYDADGNGGIIHIVTRKDPTLGTKVMASLVAGAHWAETTGVNFNLNHNGNSFRYSIDYSILRNHNLHRSFMTRSLLFNQSKNGEIINESRRENITNQQNASVDFEWKLTDRTNLNLLLTGYRRDWNLNANGYNKKTTSDSSVLTNMLVNENNTWQSGATSINIQSRFSKKSELNLYLDYLYYQNSNPSNYDNQIYYEKSQQNKQEKTSLSKQTPIQFIVARMDYTYEISPLIKISLGTKAVKSGLTNIVSVSRAIDSSNPIKDELLSSYSFLNEEIGAGYLAASWKQQENKWNINGGVRYEHTHTSVDSQGGNNIVKRNYGNLFPGISVMRIYDSENDIKLSYNRRITRPTYNDIAPYVFFWGPNTLSSGNTSLFPALADAVAVSYHISQWNSSVQFTHIRKEINSWQPEVDEANNLIYRAQNLSYLNTLSFINSYSMIINSWWEIQAHLHLQYQVAKIDYLPVNQSVSLPGLNSNFVNQFRL